jgi:hypothetical protein
LYLERLALRIGLDEDADSADGAVAVLLMAAVALSRASGQRRAVACLLDTAGLLNSGEG